MLQSAICSAACLKLPAFNHLENSSDRARILLLQCNNINALPTTHIVNSVGSVVCRPPTDSTTGDHLRAILNLQDQPCPR